MRTAVRHLEVDTPRDLPRALSALADAARAGDPLTPLAGGTDLLVAMNAGTLRARRFLNVWQLRSTHTLAGVLPVRDASANGLRIGALTTFGEIAAAAPTSRWPMLRAAAREVGAWQIQNRATIGGNIGNGSPAGDSLPVLLAAGARVELSSTTGTRTVAFDEYFTAYRTSVLRPDELIVSIRLDDPPANAVQFFRKVGTRRAQSISKVVMAGVLSFDDARRVPQARIGLGSVADRPLRAHAVEKALTGSVLDRASIASALDALAHDVRPIDDVRSSAAYRRAVATNVLRQFLESAALAPAR